MNYVVYGEGPETAKRIILGIHGWGGGADTFAPMARYVPDGTCLLSVDLPGYGFSPALTPLTVESVTEELAKFIDSVQGELTLLGNCSGAIFGMCAVLRRRSRFSRMILIDPFAYFPWYFRILLWPVVGRVFYATAFQNPLGRVLTNLGLAHRRSAESHLTSSFEALSHDVVYRYLGLLRDVGGYSTFSDLECVSEIELAIGRKSFGAIHQSAALWRKMWPHAKTQILEDAGHLPIEEATAELAKIVFVE